MLFNSYTFITAFLPIVLAGYYALRNQSARLVLLIVASYVFYAWAGWWFPILMIASTVISFVGGLAVERSTRHRRAALATGIVGALSILVFFKYAAFASGYGSSFVSLILQRGLPGVTSFTHNIVLPVGISFYTFEAISYQVDVYRGTIAAERNPFRYALFISFFPHLIAGPIVRYGKLGPQLDRFQRFDVDAFRSGLLLFSIGLSKKVLIADGISRRIEEVLGHVSQLGFVDAWLALLGFSLQIYFDFSGYSDMALGLARMFGIELPWNFDNPYRSRNPQEFWRRWHVTLSTWLRDYLYIPLGGSRKGPVRRDANLIATMALGGLWHGASSNFVWWGLWHGGLLTAHRRLSRFGLPFPDVLARFLTFFLITLGWVFFRYHVRSDIGGTFSALAGANGIGHSLPGLIPYLLVGFIVAIALPEAWRLDLSKWGALRLIPLGFATAAVLISVNASHQFLYFKF